MQSTTSLFRIGDTIREDLIIASLMTTIGGFVDAVGYAATGHLYLSFMSGNSTQFGMALARGDAHVIGWTGAVIAAFVLGAFLGSLVAALETQARLPLVLTGEFLCFVAAWMLLDQWTVEAALLLVAFAMGMQNVIHTSVAGASIGRSFVTGTLFGVGNALARVCLRHASLAEARVEAASWLAFIAGVTGGALVLGAVGLATALLAAASAVAALTTLSCLWRR